MREVASNIGRNGAVAASGACASAGFDTGGGGRLTAQLLSAAAAAKSAPIFPNLKLVIIKRMG